MSGPDALTRSVLADQVKERLLEAILDGSYPPDSRIVETAVAKELGTSQAPVREALRGLEALGIVEIIPFRGARVRRLDAAELLEAYVVRSAIEVLGARLAMARITDDDVAALLGIGEDMRRAADAGDGRALAIVDASLHEKLMQLVGQRHPAAGVALPGADVAHLHHARRPRLRPAVDRRPARPDARRDPRARHRGGRGRHREPLRRGARPAGRIPLRGRRAADPQHARPPTS